MSIFQEMEYINASKDTLQEIYFMDWANAFSSKNTPLAIRFNEDFRRKFHFSSEKDRGFTEINSIKINQEEIKWERPGDFPDIIKLKLPSPLAPNQKAFFSFTYTVKIPNEKYTRFGFSKKGYALRYWHLTPAMYLDEWQLYSHKNLNDISAQLSEYKVKLKIPKQYRLESNIQALSLDELTQNNEISLEGINTSHIELFIEKINRFHQTKVDQKIITSDIPREGLKENEVQELTKKVYNFLKENYGEVPQNKILLSYDEYLKQPIYGFNQLPKIIRPFDSKFQYEIITLKQLAFDLKKNMFISNQRKDQWFTDALQIYVLIKYVEKFYPEEKLAGKLSKVFGVRWFNAAKLKFNEQYYIGYKNMPARFLEQPLGMPKDSLLKFNYNISNPYKAGMGLHYLESFLGNDELDKTLKKFISENRGKPVNALKFNKNLEENSSKNIEWFTNEFVYEDKVTDVKINGVYRTKDSIFIRLKNKGKPVPVKVSALKKKDLIAEKWTPVITDTLSVGFPKKSATNFVIDNDGRLPERSRRNNYRKTTGIFPKSFQFRLFQDIENPKYTQIYTVPVYDFNVYDGLILGARFINKSLIPRNFSISATPNYAAKSQKIVGDISLGYVHQLKKYGWSFLNFGLSGSTFSYAPGLSFNRYTPIISLNYRPKDLRRNLSQSILTRFVNIDREQSPEVELETPNYRIWNTRYRYVDNNLTRVLGILTDFQLAENFSRVSTAFNYRRLFNNNRQVNFRFFAGKFLTNNTVADGNFFSFALDRPSDYLFDFGYFARDDDQGLASQQFINAEGNFKSLFGERRFANEWIATTSLETNIWNWIFIYGDAGFVKNKGLKEDFLYDSGIRLNLLQDYFELYFPLQSSLGFEPSFKDYGSRIRFKVTLSFTTLIDLFTREWY